jgi:hypothetical protein
MRAGRRRKLEVSWRSLESGDERIGAVVQFAGRFPYVFAQTPHASLGVVQFGSQLLGVPPRVTCLAPHHRSDIEEPEELAAGFAALSTSVPLRSYRA